MSRGTGYSPIARQAMTAEARADPWATSRRWKRTKVHGATKDAAAQMSPNGTPLISAQDKEPWGSVTSAVSRAPGPSGAASPLQLPHSKLKMALGRMPHLPVCLGQQVPSYGKPPWLPGQQAEEQWKTLSWATPAPPGEPSELISSLGEE
ncbi:hypothetical protein GOODEAATRI_026700 [Goodea atripinnis]|uniref:Uncharacterized protein n=1 Tax=Goodea atripinnis TaxID=208336 RepID=A0ABV0Q1A8_9TELE